MQGSPGPDGNECTTPQQNGKANGTATPSSFVTSIMRAIEGKSTPVVSGETGNYVDMPDLDNGSKFKKIRGCKFEIITHCFAILPINVMYVS